MENTNKVFKSRDLKRPVLEGILASRLEEAGYEAILKTTNIRTLVNCFFSVKLHRYLSTNGRVVEFRGYTLDEDGFKGNIEKLINNKKKYDQKLLYFFKNNIEDNLVETKAERAADIARLKAQHKAAKSKKDKDVPTKDIKIKA